MFCHPQVFWAALKALVNRGHSWALRGIRLGHSSPQSSAQKATGHSLSGELTNLDHMM